MAVERWPQRGEHPVGVPGELGRGRTRAFLDLADKITRETHLAAAPLLCPAGQLPQTAAPSRRARAVIWPDPAFVSCYFLPMLRLCLARVARARGERGRSRRAEHWLTGKLAA